MKKLLVLATAALVASAPGTAQSQVISGDTNRDCSLASFIGFSATACAGYFSGNLLSGSPANVSSQNSILNTLLGTAGVNYYATQLENIASVPNNTPVNFNTPLNGQTVIGMHFGNGADVFGGAPPYDGSGGGTAFFVFDAATDLNVFSTVAGLSKASSGATLYRTGLPCTNGDCPNPGIVPEPASLALMFGGLLGLAVVSRRRREV